MPLMAKPMMAKTFDLSLNRPTMLTPNASGGAKMMRIPTRDPRGAPQPNPGAPSAISSAIRMSTAHGAKERARPVFPKFMLVSYAKCYSSFTFITPQHLA